MFVHRFQENGKGKAATFPFLLTSPYVRPSTSILYDVLIQCAIEKIKITYRDENEEYVDPPVIMEAHTFIDEESFAKKLNENGYSINLENVKDVVTLVKEIKKESDKYE